MNRSAFFGFRPLLGIRFFDRKELWIIAKLMRVSVPYWGLDFLIVEKILTNSNHVVVSVPYWGLDFLI